MSEHESERIADKAGLTDRFERDRIHPRVRRAFVESTQRHFARHVAKTPHRMPGVDELRPLVKEDLTGSVGVMILMALLSWALPKLLEWLWSRWQEDREV